MHYLLIAACVLICAAFIKDKQYLFSFLLVLSGIVLILLYTLSDLKSVITDIKDVTLGVPVAGEYISLMLKVLLITLLTRLIGDICRDSGETALASVCEASCKITVVVMIMPLLKSVVKIIGGLIK